MTTNNRAEFDRLADEAFKLEMGAALASDVEHFRFHEETASAKLDTMYALASEDGRRDAVPKGWKVVARQPTRLMTIAGREWADNEYETWQAMFDAAPVPPTGEAE